MAIKSSRGVTSGKGTPQRLEGQNGDMTIRSSNKGKKLYVKDANRWHSINLDVNTSESRNDINSLLKDVRQLKNRTRNRPMFDSAYFRAPGSADVQLKNVGATLKVRNADDSADAEILAKTMRLSVNTGTASGDVGQLGFDSGTKAHRFIGDIVYLNANPSEGDARFVAVSDASKDAYFQSIEGGVNTWVFGSDYTDGGSGINHFKICKGGTMGTNCKLKIDTAADDESAVLSMFYNATNYSTITTAATGDLTIATVGSGTTDSTILLDADGDIALEAAGGDITLDAKTTVTVSDFGGATAFKIDADQPATNLAENSSGFFIDYDRAVATSGTAAHNDIGINLDINSASLGTSTVKGMDIDVVGATTGTHTAIGIDLDVDGADTNIGIQINTAGTHMKLVANADADDYATFAVADTGDLTITTVGDGATDSDLTLDVDGDIELNADGGDIVFKDNLTSMAKFEVGILNIFKDATSYARITVAASGATTISTTDGTPADADLTLDAGGDITLDSGTGLFLAKNAGTEFSAANSAYAGMILGMTIDGVDESAQSYDLTTSFVVPNALKFRFEFITPPSELVEITCSISFDASSGGQDLFMSLSNHGTYGSNSLSHPDQFETAVWNPPGRGTINQLTARWIVASGNLAAIGSNNILWIAAKTDNTSGTPKLYWGGDATEEYSPLIIKVTALPLPASITYNP